MTEEDFETECLASSENSSNKDDDALNVSPVEEDSSLLTSNKDKAITGETENPLPKYDNNDYKQEAVDGVNKENSSPKVEKNLYPNILISGSRDHSDIDTDEEDFQMRNLTSHKRNDSGQGSSITDSCTGVVQSDLKRLDLTDEESLAVDSTETSLENGTPVLGSGVPTKEFSSIDDDVAQILSKIPGGTEEVLGKVRTATLVQNSQGTADANVNASFDENDFTDIPLDSPGTKQNLNTYAPRAGLQGGSTSPDLSDDLRKPCVTDTKSKSGFR